jgi:hypothetical protein
MNHLKSGGNSRNIKAGKVGIPNQTSIELFVVGISELGSPLKKMIQAA